MFNQKVNGYWSQNPDYLNYSLGAPGIKAVDIHNCGTTIDKFTKKDNANLQTWCSKNVAVESFGMRPIVNSKEYFENIKKYLASIIYTDSINLKQSGMSMEHYKITDDYGLEPQSSLFQAINLEATNKLMFLLGEGSDKIGMFKNYNPLGEGLVMTDIDINTYQSVENPNHYFHRVIFSAFNTTRYNTITFKAELYQDASGIMNQWNTNINAVMNSQNVPKNTSGETNVYVSLIDLLNNTTCVTGQESDCEYKGYNIKSSFSQLLNDNFLAEPNNLNWVQPNSITENNYTDNGNYDPNGFIKITDNGPSNIEDILKRIFKN